jgi:hypothetical protein
MRSWPELGRAARRIDTQVITASGTDAQIVDAGDQTRLVTVSIGPGLAPLDRDRVLRATIDAALAEMRRRGA